MKICIELVEMFDVIQFGKYIYRILFKKMNSRDRICGLSESTFFLIEGNARRVWFCCVM